MRLGVRTTATWTAAAAPRSSWSRSSSFAVLFFLTLAVYGLLELLRGSVR